MNAKSKARIISKEIRQLAEITKEVSKDKRIYVDRLIGQAAFMYATLSELQGIVNEEGAIELFEQGAQKMLREHPAAKTYNMMIKNYSSIIKQLIDITPQAELEKDPLKEFLTRKPIK